MTLRAIFVLSLLSLSVVASSNLAWDDGEWTPILEPCLSCRRGRVLAAQQEAQLDAGPHHKRQVRFEDQAIRPSENDNPVQLIYLPEGTINNLRSANLAKVALDARGRQFRPARETPFQVQESQIRQTRQSAPQAVRPRKPAALIAQAGNEREAREQIQLLEAALNPNQNIPHNDGDLPRVFIAPTHVPPPPGYIKIPLVPSQDRVTNTNLPGTFLTSDVRDRAPPGFIQLPLPETVAHLSNNIPFVDPNVHQGLFPSSLRSNNFVPPVPAPPRQETPQTQDHFVVRNHQSFSRPQNQPPAFQSENVQPILFRQQESQPPPPPPPRTIHRFSPVQQSNDESRSRDRPSNLNVLPPIPHFSQPSLQRDFPPPSQFPERQQFVPSVRPQVNPFSSRDPPPRPPQNDFNQNQNIPLTNVRQEFPSAPQNGFNQNLPTRSRPLNDDRHGKAINKEPEQFNSFTPEPIVPNRFTFSRPSSVNVNEQVENHVPERSRQPSVSNVNALPPSQPKVFTNFNSGFKIGEPVLKPVNNIVPKQFLGGIQQTKHEVFRQPVEVDDRRKEEAFDTFTPTVFRETTIPFTTSKHFEEKDEIAAQRFPPISTSSFNFESPSRPLQEENKKDTRFPSPNLVEFSPLPPFTNNVRTTPSLSPPVTPSVVSFSPQLITTLPPTTRETFSADEQETEVSAILEQETTEPTPLPRPRVPTRQRTRPSRLNGAGRGNGLTATSVQDPKSDVNPRPNRRRRLQNRRRRPVRPSVQTIPEESKDTQPQQTIEEEISQQTTAEQPVTRKSLFPSFSEAKKLTEKVNADAITTVIESDPAQTLTQEAEDSPKEAPSVSSAPRRSRFGSRLRSRTRTRNLNTVAANPVEEKKEQANVFPLDDPVPQQRVRSRNRSNTRDRTERRRLNGSRRRRVRVRPISVNAENEALSQNEETTLTGSESAFIEFSQPAENLLSIPLPSNNELPKANPIEDTKEPINLLRFFSLRPSPQEFPTQNEKQTEEEIWYVNEPLDTDISTNSRTSTIGEDIVPTVVPSPTQVVRGEGTGTAEQHETAQQKGRSEKQIVNPATLSPFDSLISLVSDSSKSKAMKDDPAATEELRNEGRQSQDQDVLNYDEDVVDGDVKDEYIGSGARVVYAVALDEEGVVINKPNPVAQNQNSEVLTPEVETATTGGAETLEETTTATEEETTIASENDEILTIEESISETVAAPESEPLKEEAKDVLLEENREQPGSTPVKEAPFDILDTLANEEPKDSENEVANDDRQQRVIGQTTITEVRSSAPVICSREGKCIFGRGNK